MRFLALTLGCLGSLGGLLGNTGMVVAAPEPPPRQVRIRIADVLFTGSRLALKPEAANRELRERVVISEEQLKTLRPTLAASIASGSAATRDAVAITLLDGVAGRLEVTGKERPGLVASFVPRVTDNKIELGLRLAYGKRENGRINGPLVERTVTVSNGGSVAAVFPAAADPAGEHVFILNVDLLEAERQN